MASPEAYDRNGGVGDRVSQLMKQMQVSVPEVGLFAATRGMLAAGAMLLIAERISVKRRKMIGIPLLAIGVLSTIPFAIDFIKKTKA